MYMTFPEMMSNRQAYFPQILVYFPKWSITDRHIPKTYPQKYNRCTLPTKEKKKTKQTNKNTQKEVKQMGVFSSVKTTTTQKQIGPFPQMK